MGPIVINGKAAAPEVVGLQFLVLPISLTPPVRPTPPYISEERLFQGHVFR